MKSRAEHLALSAVLFALFLFTTLSLARSINIPGATVDYILNTDGTVGVTESIFYSLSSGSSDAYHELYIQKPTDLIISGASGYCEKCPSGKPESCQRISSCRFFTQINEGQFELVMREDNGYSATTYRIVFQYTINKEILKQKDCSQFFFKLWGDKWDNSVGTLTATVHLPQDAASAEVFVHPVSGNIAVNKMGNDIRIDSFSHPANTYLEANIVMPQGWFSNLEPASNYMSKQEIIDGEKSYINWESLKWIIDAIFVLFLPALFVVLYLIYGREKPLPELDALAIYEREPPSDLSPAEAAYLINNQVGPASISGEVMWLVQNKYLTMEEIEVEFKGIIMNEKKKTVGFKPTQKDPKELKPHQIALYYFIASKVSMMPETKGYFIFDSIEKNYSAQVEYRAMNREFTMQAIKFFSEKKYLSQDGNVIMGAAAGISLFINWTLGPLLGAFLGWIIGLLVIESFAFLAIVLAKREILGQWSPEGRILERKWENYKRFMKEMTLMREKEPMGIILWETLLVYATAFGVADKVISQMKTMVPEEQMRRSNLHAFAMCSPMIAHSISSASMSSSGGHGHSGGGFGGGHGGGGGGGGGR